MYYHYVLHLLYYYYMYYVLSLCITFIILLYYYYMYYVLSLAYWSGHLVDLVTDLVTADGFCGDVYWLE